MSAAGVYLAVPVAEHCYHLDLLHLPCNQITSSSRLLSDMAAKVPINYTMMVQTFAGVYNSWANVKFTGLLKCKVLPETLQLCLVLQYNRA